MSIGRRLTDHGLTDRAPLRLHLRYAFHDWMWSGGDKDQCGWRRRLARRLPEYFTDPDMDGMPRSKAEFDEMVADGRLTKVEVTTGPPSRELPPGSNLTFDFTTGKIYPTPQTWGSCSP